MLTVLERLDSREEARQVASVAYSYAVIRVAAEATMAQTPSLRSRRLPRGRTRTAATAVAVLLLQWLREQPASASTRLE
jgi:hypothetical protein